MLLLGMIIGFVVGLITYAVIRSISHTHDYELLFHRKIKDFGFNCKIYFLSSEIWDIDCTRINRYELHDKIYADTVASYRKCKRCGHVILTLSDGTTRSYNADMDKLQNDIELILQKEKAEKEELDMRLVNARLYPDVHEKMLVSEIENRPKNKQTA